MLETRAQRIYRGREIESGKFARIDQHAMLTVALLPRRADFGISGIVRLDHRDDVDALLRREREVALVMRRDTHHGALAISHQHVVGDPHFDGRPGEGMPHVQTRGTSLLLHGGDVRLHGAATTTLVDERLQRRIARSRSEGQRMLRGDRHESHAEQRVDARGEHLECTIGSKQRTGVIRIGERDFGALTATDPVRLHGLHALRPALERGEVPEQFVGIRGDVEVVHRDFALLDERARAPAPPIDHLLVGEHRLIDRIPVHHAGFLVGDALLAHAQEEPLVPAIVGRVAGGDLAIPIDRETERLQLLFHVRDVVPRPLGWCHAVGHRRVLGGQAKGVPAHRLQDVQTLHAREARQHVTDRVIAHMPHVQATRRVREHRQAVELAATRRVLARSEAALGVPVLLGRPLYDGRIVTFIHG